MAILATAVAAVLVFSAGAGRTADAAEFVKKSPLTIGYSIQSAQDPYWQGYIHGIEDEMKKYGFTKMLTQDSQASAQKQVSGSLALINDGISALIISPRNRARWLPPRPRRTGRRSRSSSATSAPPATTTGSCCPTTTMAASLPRSSSRRTLADRTGVQEVAVIGLNPTTSVNGPRTDGFTQTMAKNANIKVVANISGHQTLEGGFKAAQAILAANPKVAAIYCENDSMAAGAGPGDRAGRRPQPADQPGARRVQR